MVCRGATIRLTSHAAKMRDRMDLNPRQLKALAAAELLMAAISPFTVDDLVGMFRAGGEYHGRQGAGALACTLASLARNNFLYRRPDGAYESPDKRPVVKVTVPSSIRPPSDFQKMAGNARVARLPRGGEA